MYDDFFNKKSENRSRDGYMNRNENNGQGANGRRSEGRTSRPRISRDGKVGSSNYSTSASRDARGGGYRSNYNNEGRGETRERRFFSPEGGAIGNNPNRRPQGGGENRWNKRPAGAGYNRSGASSSAAAGEGRPYSGYGSRPNGGFKKKSVYGPKKRMEYKEEFFDPNAPVRLNKYLANAGICSRRDADKYIQAGVVTVNGEVVTELGTKVMRSDVVLFHDDAVKMEKKVYILLNKPKGYVTTSEDPQNRKTVMDLVKGACPERIYPVGRLDRNTTGVLLLTNDGELASKLTHPKFLKKKIYHVTTDQNVTAAHIREIAEGITLEDGDIKADAIEYVSDTDKKQVGIEIHSGKNRIVRRIFEHFDYRVTKLDRVYFAGLTKKNVKRGDWRFLTEKEVTMLKMGAYE